MPRLQDEAPRDETITRTFTVVKPNGGNMRVRTTFYPNRVTWERSKDAPGDEDEPTESDRTTLRAATEFCKYAESWDLEGPWSVDGEQVAADGEMIPITVPVLRSADFPAWITAQLMTQIMEAVFPNLRELQRSRRR